MVLRMYPALPTGSVASCDIYTITVFFSEAFQERTAVPCLVTGQCRTPPLLILIFKLSKTHTQQLCYSWELPSLQ